MISVRPYRPEDREAISRISCDTALLGQPIDSLLNDRTLVADSLVGYYVEFEPESTFVAEMDGQVIGYLTGCKDTHRYEQICARRILPRLLRRFFRRGHLFHPNGWRLLIAVGKTAARWGRLRRSVVAEHPAHCHINLAAGSRHAGTGSALIEVFFNHLRSQKISGIHIISATETGKSFFKKAGFELLGCYPSPSLPGVPQRDAWIMGKKL